MEDMALMEVEGRASLNEVSELVEDDGGCDHMEEIVGAKPRDEVARLRVEVG